MATTQLNKKLYTEITRLKLLNKSDSRPRFILEQSPFNEDDDDDDDDRNDVVIVGRIFPNSEIYNQGSFRIEIKLTRTYPLNPPIIRFLTPIYHPNISKDGIFCYELFHRYERYSWTTPLVDAVRTLVHYVDNPDTSLSAHAEMGIEYMQNKSVFDRKAMEYVKRHALPRSQS